MSGIQQLLLGGSPAGYQIERSLRFNSADSAYLNRTPASAGNRKTWTWSGWVKRSAISTNQSIFGAAGTSDSTQLDIRFSDTDLLRVDLYTVTLVATTQVFRDISAWYHIVVAFDSTQATASDRLKIYLNGTQITAFSTNNISGSLTQNGDFGVNRNAEHNIGRYPGVSTYYVNGYLTEINFIDGQALTPSSFGQTNASTGVWEPKAFSGTYGTNGFYLKFADNSNTTAATLGKDSSGNGNNWTPNNFSVTAGAGNDSLVDTPTSYGTDTGAGGEVRGNYATLNPLYKGTNVNLTDGNLKFGLVSGNYHQGATGTIFPTSGKWYAEVTWAAVSAGTTATAVCRNNAAMVTDPCAFQNTVDTYSPTYRSYIVDGNKNTNTTSAAYGSSYGANDVIGIALDLDNGKVWFAKNGTWQASGDPAAGTNAAFTDITGSDGWTFAVSGYGGGGDNCYVNFGQRPFAYTAPSGFKALCTQNLPTPTIGATSTTQANRYFDVGLWTGNGVNGRDIANLYNFNPDAVWIKSRSNAIDHNLADVLRSWKELYPNLTNAEGSQQMNAPTNNGLSGLPNANGYNINNYTYASWVWKANGAGSSNTAGTITSTVSANTTAGFSIVTYTGNGTTGATVGHGLGVKPSMMIFKGRTNSVDWVVYHTSLGATKNLKLNLTDAEATQSGQFNDTEPTSTLFTLGANSPVNSNTVTYVAYCFAPVAGYSAFGSYTGNGSTDGPFVYLGFRPRYLLVKRTDTISSWMVVDSARDTYNMVTKGLYPNLSDAEGTGDDFDFLSNGFKLRDTGAGNNASGGTYIYAAFAESPFKYSLAR